MSSLKRAFLYDVRKKGKSLTLFLLLLLLTVSVMVGISIRSGTEKEQKELGFSALEICEKCMYHGQTLVCGSIRISPAVLKPLDKTGNHLGRYHM